MPCSNQIKFTKMCFRSIHACTHYPYELIVVDNGSVDRTSRWLKSSRFKIRLIHNKKNLGAPKAFNQGIKVSIGDYIIFLNNDTIVSEGWLGKLVKWAESDKKVGIVGACTNLVSESEAQPPTVQRMAAVISLTTKGEYKEVPGLTSFCMLVKRKVLEDVGGFDENYGPGTNDDHDFCLRVKMAGYKIICAMDTFVFHFYNRTLGNFNIRELDRRNREYFVKKFGKKGIEYLNSIKQPYGTRGENPNYISNYSCI